MSERPRSSGNATSAPCRPIVVGPSTLSANSLASTPDGRMLTSRQPAGALGRVTWTVACSTAGACTDDGGGGGTSATGGADGSGMPADDPVDGGAAGVGTGGGASADGAGAGAGSAGAAAASAAAAGASPSSNSSCTSISVL